MINFIKNMFRTNEETVLTSEDLFKKDKDIYEDEALIYDANGNAIEPYLYKHIKVLDNYDSNKPSIIILDDNEGVISFLMDDLYYLSQNTSFNVEDYNILTFSSSNGVFALIGTIKKYNITNIKYAIYDITLGGGIFDPYHGNIILDGVDAFKEVYQINMNHKFLFFTGNRLNKYIKKNQEIIDKFKEVYHHDLEKYIMHKASYDIAGRRECLREFLGV